MNNRPARHCFWRMFAAIAALPMASPAAEKAEMTVQLPPFIVERPAGGTPWRHLETPRLEVLSTCNELTTSQLVLAFHRAHELLDLVLPPKFQLAFDGPQALILYDRKLWPEHEQAAVAALLLRDETTTRSAESASPALLRGDPLTGMQLVDRSKPAGNRTAFLSNLMLSDADSITTFALAGDGALDIQRPYVTAAYVHMLLRGRTPALPAWFTSGFEQLYQRMEFRGRTVTVVLTRRGDAENLTPLARLLRDDPPVETASDRWDADVRQFICWGLDPDGGRTEAFWRFVERASANASTESIFRECFGLGFDDAAAQIEEYGRKTIRLRWTLPAERDRLPQTSVLVDASSGQVARIKGEWERLEARYVQRTRPELASQYLALARQTLQKAYDRGDRDPHLLASLGLLELELGEKTTARVLLEEAQQVGAVRPRASYELALLRYKALLGRSRRSDGKFPGAQIEPLLAPLLLTARQSPPMAAVFELMAEAAGMAIEPPSPEVLSALKAGVLLFPTHRDLAAKVAALHRLAGQNDEADTLLAVGAHRQPNPATTPLHGAFELLDRFPKIELLP
jgi:hypothetical protein